MLLMEDIGTTNGARHSLRRLLHNLSRPLQLAGRQLHPSASVGVAFYPDDGTHLDQLMERADCAMYRAKKAGGLQVASC